MAFTVGAVGADVEPDFTETRAKTERGLERVERGLAVEVAVVPNVTKSFAAKLKADLRKQSQTLAIPVTAELPKAAAASVVRQLKAELKAKPATVQVTPTVSKSGISAIGRQIRNELKTSAKAIEVPITATVNKSSAAGIRRQLRELHVAVPLEFDVTADSVRNIKEAEKELPNIRVTAELNMVQSQREIARNMKLLEKQLPKLTLNVDISTADLMGGATRKMVQFNGMAKKESAKAGRDAGDSFTDGMRAKLAIAGPKLNTAFKGAVSGIGKTGAVAGKAAGGIVSASLVTAGAGFGIAVKKASEYQTELSELQVVSSATAKQMNELSTSALKAGADTVFSAAEAANAQTELAKAGESTNDILKGGLTGTLSLAAAGGLELADAATVTANALNAFKLSGDQTSHVADLLAAAANKSAADVSDLAPALQQSALVASQMGLSIEETTGTLAAFAQAGLKGSDAGTSFKTFLQRLTPQSKEAADMMRELGLSFYDANGAFVGLPAVAGQLQDSLKGLTEEQRNQAFQTLFGSDAVRAAAVVYGEGQVGVNKWTDAVNDAGFASEVAKGKLDNLSGDLENLKGSFETVFIGAGMSAQTGLRGIVQSMTDLVNSSGPALQGIINPVSKLVTELFPKLAPLLEPIADIVGTVVDAFTPLFGPLADAMGVALGGIAEAFSTLGPVVGDAFKTLQPVFDLLGEFVAVGAGALGNLAEAILPVLAESFAAIAKAAMPVVDALGPIIREIAPQLGETFGRLVKAIQPLLPVLGDALLGVIEALIPVLPTLVDLFVDFVELAVIPLVPLIPPLIKVLSTLFKLVASKPVIAGFIALKVALIAYKGTMAAIAIATKVWAAAQLAFNAIMAANPVGLVVAAVAALGVAVVVAYKKFKPFRDVVDSIGRFFRDTLWPAIKNVAAIVGTGLAKAFKTVQPVLQKVWDLIYSLQIGPIIKGLQALFKLFTGDFSGAADAFGSIFSGIADARYASSRCWAATLSGRSRIWLRARSSRNQRSRWLVRLGLNLCCRFPTRPAWQR
jgi:TP901 family phage tail tape measure protein